ncbi:MAG: nicotinamide riboside transporter PnuC [Bacteroidales bacterium]|nr:nicotinamide riboside transporter PnuC [Bacteroidales bacterium]
MKKKFFFTPYELFLLITIIVFNIVIFCLKKEYDIDSVLSAIATISGVFCVVLVAKGHISNYIFGLIQVSLYAYCSWGVGYWGEVVLNAFYYVPMQFIGFFMWRKRIVESSKTEVKARSLSTRQRVIGLIGCAVLVVICAEVLRHFKDPAPYLDSTTTVLSVVAMLLMVKTYSEQWILWIVVNVATITMWLMSYFRGEGDAIIISSMWVVYLLNSINGFIQWDRKARNELRKPDEL